MRKIFCFTKFLLLFLFLSCSNDDGTSNNNGLSDNVNFKKLASIKSEKSPQFKDTLIYDNDRLILAYFPKCSGTLHKFEYLNSSKVINRSEILGVNSIKENIDGKEQDKFSLSYDKNGLKEELELKREDTSGGGVTFEQALGRNVYFYNEDGILTSIVYTEGDYTSTTSINYANGKISKITVGENTYTFEFDNYPNPLYELSKKYGFIRLETCGGFDFFRDELIFKNNVVKASKNNEVYFVATYEYDGDGYPIKRNYTNTSFTITATDTEVFTYLK